MRTVRIFLAAAALATGAVALPAAGASAAMPDSRAAFGNHVSECAKAKHFSGAHNPGMHQGASGWDGMHHGAAGRGDMTCLHDDTRIGLH